MPNFQQHSGPSCSQSWRRKLRLRWVGLGATEARIQMITLRNLCSHAVRVRILTAGVAFGRHRSVFLSCLRCDGSCAKHLTVEFYTVVTLLTFILIIISIKSPPRSSIPGLNLPFSANPTHRSLPFLLHDILRWFPGPFTVTFEHIRF